MSAVYSLFLVYCQFLPFVTDLGSDCVVSVVEFASHSDMKNALDKLDGTELNGRKIKLYEDRKRRYAGNIFGLRVCLSLFLFFVSCSVAAGVALAAPPVPALAPGLSQQAEAAAERTNVKTSGTANGINVLVATLAQPVEHPKRSRLPSPSLVPVLDLPRQGSSHVLAPALGLGPGHSLLRVSTESLITCL